MRGDDRTRSCLRCSLHVFNVSELTEAETRSLLLKQGGVVCGRLFRRPDGTVLTRDCPTGVRALRLRFVRGLAAAATLLAGLVGLRVATRDPACPTVAPGDMTAFARLETAVDERFVELREALRETQTFGPLIEKLSPTPRMTMGRMLYVPIIKPTGSQPPLE